MRTLIFLLFFILSNATSATSSPILTDRFSEAIPILEHAFWLSNSEGATSITEASSAGMQRRYASLKKGFSATDTGGGWLRVELKKTELLSQNLQSLILHFNDLPPGTSTLFHQNNADPASTSGGWYSTPLRAYEDIHLPQPSLNGTFLYIHFEETPGLWFSPTLSSSADENQYMIPPDLVLPGLLLAGILVCLLRGVKDMTLWPIWAALLLGLVLMQVLLPLPIIKKNFGFAALPAILAPGLCLMLYPHLGRLMLLPKEYSPLQDSLLKVTPILGVITCLLPLIPGYGWTMRFFPLWPLFLLPLLPFCFSALAHKRPGALIFSGVCFLPIIGALWSLWALFSHPVHPFAIHGGLWGVAIGGITLFLARVSAPEKSYQDVSHGIFLQPAETPSLSNDTFSAPVVRPIENVTNRSSLTTDEPATLDDILGTTSTSNKEDEKNEIDSLSKISILDDTPFKNVAEQSVATQEKYSDQKTALLPNHVPVLESQLSMPTLQADTKEANQPINASPANNFTVPARYGSMASLFNEVPQPVNDSETSLDNGNIASTPDTVDAASHAILKESTLPIASTDSTPTTFEEVLTTSLADESIKSSKTISREYPSPDRQNPMKIISLADEDFDDDYWNQQVSTLGLSSSNNEAFVFNLHGLVRDVHAAAAPLAEDKGILLSWFIAPSLPSYLEGDAACLRQALSLLLQNAVQATQQGAVQLFIRHDPASPITEYGSLQFTISDTGVAQRADAGFFHAWELAQRTGGSFSIEYSITGGTLVIFSAKFTLPSEKSLMAYSQELPTDTSESLRSEEIPLDQMFPLSAQLARESGFLEGHTEVPSMEEKTHFDDDVDPSIPRFIIGDMTTSNKRLLAHYLSDIPHVMLEAKNINNILELFRRASPALIIYDADSPEDGILKTIGEIKKEVEVGEYPLPAQLVIVGHDTQAKRMLNGGATHVIQKPFTEEDFLNALYAAIPSLQGLATTQIVPEPARIRINAHQKAPSPIITASSSHMLPAWADEATPEEHAIIQANPFPQGQEELALPTQKISLETGKLELMSSSIEEKQSEISGSAIEEEIAMPFSVANNDNDTIASLYTQNNDDVSQEFSLTGESSEKEHNQDDFFQTPSEVDQPITSALSVPAKSVAPAMESSPNTHVPSPVASPTEIASDMQSDQAPAKNEQEEENQKSSSPASMPGSRLSTHVIKKPIQVNLAEANTKDATFSNTSSNNSSLENAGDMLFGPLPTGTYPLPDIEGEALEVVMLPLVPGLLHTLNDCLADSIKARGEHQTLFIQEATNRLAGKAELFGLVKLGKIARCVERAAEADDFEAVDTLLDDLINVTQRYIESLKTCYEAFRDEVR